MYRDREVVKYPEIRRKYNTRHCIPGKGEVKALQQVESKGRGDTTERGWGRYAAAREPAQGQTWGWARGGVRARANAGVVPRVG